MKKFSIFFMLVFGISMLCIPPSVNANLIFYTSRAAFNAAAPGLPVEDFEEARIAPFQVEFMGGNLDKYTNNAYFQPGEILDGLRVQTDPPGGLWIAGAMEGVITKRPKIEDWMGEISLKSIDLNFYNNNVDAIGMDITSWYILDAIVSISIFGKSGLLGGCQIQGGVDTNFLGVTSTDIITRISLSPYWNIYPIGIDNVAFTPVPEPTTMLLLCSGLIGLAGYGRKKFFRK